jgi:hypothetical protein
MARITWEVKCEVRDGKTITTRTVTVDAPDRSTAEKTAKQRILAMIANTAAKITVQTIKELGKAITDHDHDSHDHHHHDDGSGMTGMM